MSAHPHTARAQRLPSKARVNTAHSVRRARRSPQPGRRLSGQRAHNRSSVRSPRETAAWLVGRVCFLEHQSFGPKGEGAAFGDSRAGHGQRHGLSCLATRRGAVSTLWPKRAGSAHQQVAKACEKASVKQKGRGDARPSARPAASSRPSGYESAITRTTEQSFCCRARVRGLVKS